MAKYTGKKSFGTAFALWFFTGGIGGHRVYVNEKVSVLLWYWLAAICTLGILPLVDAFKLKGQILEVNEIVESEEN